VPPAQRAGRKLSLRAEIAGCALHSERIAGYKESPGNRASGDETLRRWIMAALAAGAVATGAAADECPGNPGALGTSRTIVVDPSEYGRIGTMQYGHTLPLADHEVVLTFDDGPIPPYTARVLDILAKECIHATFFIVGRQAHAFPQLVRRVHDEGHTVANHSLNHPRMFNRLPTAKMHEEIEEGFAASAAALGDAGAVARFFRVPGLRSSAAVEAYLASQNVMVWSADFPADDWRHISAAQVKQRALDRLEAKGKGVLLLHDIQPATVLALPELLKELKARGYRIVHVTTATADRPKTPTQPEQWVLRPPPKGTPHGAWPRVVEPAAVAGETVQLPVTPPLPPERATASAAGAAAPPAAAARRAPHSASLKRSAHARPRLHGTVPREPAKSESAPLRPGPQAQPDHRRLRKSAQAERRDRPAEPATRWPWSLWQ
jgi:peptidoglycan/xylan/chitin deacetylase (PgdA/CDA1 family)